MRMMVTVKLDTETGNELIQSGKIGDAVEQVLQQLKPEAAYFMSLGGHRAIVMVVNITDPSELVPISEPFWQQLNATVEVTPCMTAEDLKAGLSMTH